MIDAVIDRIRALDHAREHRALTEHVAVTSPIALELLAYEKLTSVGHEARYIAGVQLRVVRELADNLRWLEQLSVKAQADPGVRAALAGLLHSLCAESELLPVSNSDATVLLEPAILFHALLTRLRPWIPPVALALEPDLVVEMLQLGIPDYLHPLLRQRYEQLWALFHRLRRQPRPQLDTSMAPPAPFWMTPRWVMPWRERDDAPPPAASNIKGNERTG